MESMSQEELNSLLKGRDSQKAIDLREKKFENMDLSEWDLSNIDFSWSDFENVDFTGAVLENSSIESALFKDCIFHNAILKNANMKCASLRYCDLSGTNIEGADLLCAILEYANLKGVISNKGTKFYSLYCPEEGAFLGYKKCFNNRLVQLLIPADAKRSSATSNACRCSKAKVLTIKSFDYLESFKEAWSFVDENFVYRVGEYVEAENFNEDRWMDSAAGIHFWMTREEAFAY